MPAARVLVVDLRVARFAIARRNLRGNHEAVVFFFLLALRGLMAIEAAHAVGRVFAHLIFVNHGVLLVQVAFRAFSGGAHELRVGLLHLNGRPGALNQECSKYQRKRDNERNENITKGHGGLRQSTVQMGSRHSLGGFRDTIP